MARTPRISDIEWEIMRVLWAGRPLSAAEIFTRLSALDATWHPKTTRTMLGRLVEKKAIGCDAAGRTYVYRPRVSEADCVAAASGSFVERVFGGALKPMLAHFIEHRRLTRKELDELRELLDRAPRAASAKREPK